MSQLLPSKVNIIPIREVVILPSGRVAFKIGREKSKYAIRDAINSHGQIATFSQIDASTEFPEINDLHPIGILCDILSHEETPDNLIKVVVLGIKRVRISKLIKSSPFFVIVPEEVTLTNSESNVTLPPKKDIKGAVALLLKYRAELNLYLSSSLDPTPYDTEPGRLADFLVQRSATSFDNQVACLLELNPRKRLKLAYEVLVKEGQQAKLESEINEQVTMAIKDAHREIFLRGQLKIILEQLGENAPLSLYNPIFRGKSFKINPKLSFVLMPFAEEFRPIYNEIIKPVVERFGLTCIRADDLYGSKAIIEDIWKLVNEAKIIIADVTGKNPNVFYEIGLAHAVGKEVIIISQTIDDVPFDLRHIRCFIYKDSVAGFRKLETQLQQVLSSIDGLIKDEPPS